MQVNYRSTLHIIARKVSKDKVKRTLSLYVRQQTPNGRPRIILIKGK